ncbi:MAG: hypothetical protein QOJ64_3088 [Acidobacteriota bacterium]|jgi:hypothetical protein|nr:hypothetical protein [Acidobacteriota bacterium]
MSENQADVTRPIERLELIAAILLGLAAIATAFASYQSSLYDGRSVENYSRSNKTATEAAAERSRAIVAMARDNSVDAEAMRLILEGDGAPSPAAEERNYAIATYLYTRQMSESGYKALGLPPEARKIAEAPSVSTDVEQKATALQEQILEKAMEKDLAGDENYRKEMLAQSHALFDESEKYFKLGQDANETGDKFQLIAVIFAIGLFFGGIVQVFRNDRVRRAIISVSGVFLIVGTIYMLTLPLIFS